MSSESSRIFVTQLIHTEADDNPLAVPGLYQEIRDAFISLEESIQGLLSSHSQTAFQANGA